MSKPNYWIPLDVDLWPPMSQKDKHRTDKLRLLLHCGKTITACLWNGTGNKAGCCYATHWKRVRAALEKVQR